MRRPPRNGEGRTAQRLRDEERERRRAPRTSGRTAPVIAETGCCYAILLGSSDGPPNTSPWDPILTGASEGLTAPTFGFAPDG